MAIRIETNSPQEFKELMQSIIEVNQADRVAELRFQAMVYQAALIQARQVQGLPVPVALQQQDPLTELLFGSAQVQYALPSAPPVQPAPIETAITAAHYPAAQSNQDWWNQIVDVVQEAQAQTPRAIEAQATTVLDQPQKSKATLSFFINMLLLLGSIAAVAGAGGVLLGVKVPFQGANVISPSAQPQSNPVKPSASPSVPADTLPVDRLRERLGQPIVPSN